MCTLCAGRESFKENLQTSTNGKIYRTKDGFKIERKYNRYKYFFDNKLPITHVEWHNIVKSH